MGGAGRVWLRIGCCGFATARNRYFATFNVVEIQKSFYSPPSPSTINRWREEAPRGFEYTLKAWQLITHPPSSPTYRRLGFTIAPEKESLYGLFRPTEEVHRAWQTTKGLALALGAGCVLFQSPPSFRPTEQNIKNMELFFSSIDRAGLTLLWEPRGDWPAHTIKALCRKHRLVHVVDPFKASPLWGSIRYYRLHGTESYNHRYSEEELERLASMLEPQVPTYVMFNNIYMFEDAKRFKGLLKGQGVL